MVGDRRGRMIRVTEWANCKVTDLEFPWLRTLP